MSYAVLSIFKLKHNFLYFNGIIRYITFYNYVNDTKHWHEWDKSQADAPIWHDGGCLPRLPLEPDFLRAVRVFLRDSSNSYEWFSTIQLCRLGPRVRVEVLGSVDSNHNPKHMWPICTKPVTCRRKHKLSFSYVQKEEKMGFNLVQKTFICDN